MTGDGDGLIAELATMTRLYELATRFVRDGDLPALLDRAVVEAIDLVGADTGYLGLWAQPDGELTLAAQRGCERLALGPGALGAVRARGERLVIEDLAGSEPLLESGERGALLAAGVRALQLTPLRGPSSTIVGFLSTHHHRVHEPEEHQLRALDLLARLCADAIERTRTGEARAQAHADAAWAERLRETEELFRSTVENMPVNLVLCDRDGTPLYFNPQLAASIKRMCQRPPEQVLGLPGGQVWPPPIWGPLHAAIQRALAAGERQSYELSVVLPDGQRMVREWAVVPLAGPDGEIHRILALSHDITAQHRLLDEAREADRRKSEFIAVLSHELRNPLAAIRTSLYLLEHERSGEKAAAARRIVDRQVSQLVRLVDDLLDVTRIAQQKVRLDRQLLDVNELVRQTLEDNRAPFDSAGVRLEVKLADRPLLVDADGARLAQVVTNLLSNAAKFTPEGGTVTVSVSADAAGHAVLGVADTGSGIEPALLPRVFEPFMQGDRTLDRSGGGLGVGLALVRGLVELHGGEVSASSAGSGKGAELVVRLPLAVEPVCQPAAEVTAPSALVRRRVLVIEDDRDVAEGLKGVLELDGHLVQVAHTGRAGIEAARLFSPDVVLCDIGLPELDGYQVARAMRADDQLRTAYLVALSGYAQAEDRAAARAAGFDRHVAKPASIPEIQQAIADSLEAGAPLPPRPGDG